MTIIISSRVPKSRKMDRQSRKHLLDEPKCIEKGYMKGAGKVRFSANGEQITRNTVRIDLWRFAHALHICLYFVKGHRRMLGTKGNGCPKAGRECGFCEKVKA